MDVLAGRRVLAAAVLAAACVAAALAVAFRGEEPAPAEPVGSSADVFAWTGGTLMRVDPVSLHAKAPALAIDLGPTAFARDDTTLAVAGSNAPLVRLVDLRRMRLAGRGIDLGRNVFVDTMHWLDATTIATVVWGDPPQLLFVDVAKRRVVERRDLTGVVFARAKTRDVLVLLVGPADRIGASTLVVVDAARGIRTVTLDEVSAGFTPVGDSRSGDHRRVAPGLAVDPTGRRAVVVPPGGRVAEVDLDSLAVRYHELARPASLLGRLRGWLEPAAYAKSVVGPERHAQWIGDDSVAVVALEQAGIEERDGGNRQLARATGVQLIDTTSWSIRTLSDRAGAVAVAAETLLVYGGPFSAGGSFSADDGPAVTGLHGFTPGGQERFRLFPSRHVGHVETAGRYAYATSRGAGAIDVIDAAAGRIVGTVQTPTHLFIVAP
jgi:hypothetical protein